MLLSDRTGAALAFLQDARPESNSGGLILCYSYFAILAVNSDMLAVLTALPRAKHTGFPLLPFSPVILFLNIISQTVVSLGVIVEIRGLDLNSANSFITS